jgi:hypothetical protein
MEMETFKGRTRDVRTRIGSRIVRPFACAGLLIGFVFSLVEAAWILIARGPGYIGWVRPSDCKSFNSWMSAEWRYYGRGGMQVGVRRFGLEVARKGHLSRRHPLD